MTNRASPGAAATRPWRKWWALTAVLTLVGAGCLVLGLHQHRHPLAGPAAAQRSLKAPVTTSTATPDTAAPIPSNVIPAVTERSTPTELQIPGIGLRVSLSTLGLNLDGTVQVPSNVQQPGWYRLGPSPGQLGSAVILGHVDSYRGPAVFFKLRSLVAGDPINVNLADGTSVQFKVTFVSTYLKSNFPDQAVYGPHGFSGLQLVTCGGTFDAHTGHYLSNIVVYSSLASVTPPSVTPQN
jgi:hypothetical protein